MANTPIVRDEYGAVTGREAAEALERFQAALPERRVEFDRHQRGDAINHALYGLDLARDLAVIQVRHAFRQRRRGYLNVRKTYVLAGFTEVGAPFRHPVSAAVVRAAVRKHPDDPAMIVGAAERWIFRVTKSQYARSLRQGDVLMFRARGAPKDAACAGNTLTLAATHEVRAHEIRTGRDGEIFAYDPALYHTKAQHEPVYADGVDGWWIVRLGRAAPTWNFAERLGD